MLCVWCFDLMSCNGKDLREMPLTVRKLRLGRLLRSYAHPLLRYSESFISADKLFEMARKMALEGVVSKRRNGMYHARRCDWVKVKTPEWKKMHKDRGSASQWTIFANRAPATNADVHANVAIRKFC